MVKLYGQDWRADELRRHVGTMDQLAGITAGERTDGPGRGVRTLEVQTGSGLAFTVLPERGMDLGEARLNGVPLTWQSAMGVVHPSRYEREGRGWERSFSGGLLATCGLDNIGMTSTDEGTVYPQHGRINHIPATHVRYDAAWQGDEYVLTIEGRVRQVTLFGEHLLLMRRIETRLGSDALSVIDTVSNEGYRPEPVLLLHHINLGFPVLAETSELVLPPATRSSSDDASMRRGDAPGAGTEVVIHEIPAGPDGLASVALVNRAFDDGRGIGVAIRYTQASFPFLWQWRNLRPGELCWLTPSSALVTWHSRWNSARNVDRMRVVASTTYRTAMASPCASSSAIATGSSRPASTWSSPRSAFPSSRHRPGHRMPTPLRSASSALSARSACTGCSSVTRRTCATPWRNTRLITTTGDRIRAGIRGRQYPSPLPRPGPPLPRRSGAGRSSAASSTTTASPPEGQRCHAAQSLCRRALHPHAATQGRPCQVRAIGLPASAMVFVNLSLAIATIRTFCHALRDYVNRQQRADFDTLWVS